MKTIRELFSQKKEIYKLNSRACTAAAAEIFWKNKRRTIEPNIFFDIIEP